MKFEILAAVIVTIMVFVDVMPCSLVDPNSGFLQNIGMCLPNYVMSDHRELVSVYVCGNITVVG